MYECYYVNACITLPIRCLRCRLTGSVTVLTVLTVQFFFALEQKFRTVRPP